MSEEPRLPDRLEYPTGSQDRYDKVHAIRLVGGWEMIGGLMVDHDDVDIESTEAFASEVARRWNSHDALVEACEAAKAHIGCDATGWYEDVEDQLEAALKLAEGEKKEDSNA